jgi:hypothetical protein
LEFVAVGDRLEKVVDLTGSEAGWAGAEVVAYLPD